MPCVAISLLFAIVFFFFLPLQRLIEISAVTNSGMQHAGWIEAPLAVQAAKKCQIGLWECTLALTYTRIHTPVARNAYAVACQRITVPLKWLMHKQTQSQIYSHGLQRMHHSSITHPLQASKRWLMHSATTKALLQRVFDIQGGHLPHDGCSVSLRTSSGQRYLCVHHALHMAYNWIWWPAVVATASKKPRRWALMHRAFEWQMQQIRIDATPGSVRICNEYKWITAKSVVKGCVLNSSKNS